MAKRTQTFLREFVILFGFLNGLWLAIGVNPGARLLGVVEGVVENLVSGAPVRLLFTLAPLVFLVVILWLIRRKGGWVGFLAVGCGFLAGLQVLVAPEVSFGLLVAALVLGWFATR